MDSYLDAVLLGGRERRAIVICDYDRSWRVRFEAERARVLSALGGAALLVEHFSSTAVPGLVAKPIIDVLVTVADPMDEDPFRQALEEQGYQLRVREPGQRMFRPAALDVHIHVWAETDPEVGRHLRFRDRLRSSAGDRVAYERLKRYLTSQDWPDMNHYAEAKDALIREVLAASEPQR